MQVGQQVTVTFKRLWIHTVSSSGISESAQRGREEMKRGKDGRKVPSLHRYEQF